MLAFNAINFPQNEACDQPLVKAAIRGKIVGFKYAHRDRPNHPEWVSDWRLSPTVRMIRQV